MRFTNKNVEELGLIIELKNSKYPVQYKRISCSVKNAYTLENGPWRI